MAVRKQFIAGARCPHCNAEDKVRLCREETLTREMLREWIECVACGHVTENPGEPEHPNPTSSPDASIGVVRFPLKK
ncbi:MAG: YheV family putative metal-binding protein [Pedobacter sp.]|nr:YheV family putative metal-binding protein [Pedobacter sp.]